MAWSTPRTWTVGEVLTAANLNSFVSNDLAFLGTPPSCRVTNSAAVSIPNTGPTAITFNTERYKTDAGMHSTSANTTRLVCTVAGKYMIAGHVEFASNATGVRHLQIGLNGAVIIAVHGTTAENGLATPLSVATIWQLAVNDYVELLASQTSAGALNANLAASYSPEFEMAWIGF